MKKIISLNGEWDFIADLDPKYHRNSRYVRSDCDRRHWMKATAPGVWNKYDRRYDVFEGICYLAREFTVRHLKKGSAARLRFGGVNYLARVYLNGNLIGEHEGGYTEFCIDAAEHMRTGRNLLVVQVDNRATSMKWPPVLGYFNYGGIHRDVSLEITEGPALDNIRITAEPHNGGGKLRVCGQVLNPGRGQRITIKCEGFSKTCRPAKNARFSCAMNVPGVKHWSPDNPSLYDVHVELSGTGKKLDQNTVQCGFRKIELRNREILLNGAPLRLKGICYVYDSPRTGLVMTGEQIAKDIKLMKQLGVNSVRCHYPMDASFYTACDRAGIMVWIETPIYCLHPADRARNTPFADPASRKVAFQMFHEMIAVAHNHPSVCIYGIGNECNLKNREAGDFFRQCARMVRKADATRLISYAALYGNVGSIAEEVDVLGVNSYWGWYDKIFSGKGLSPEKACTTRRREPINLRPMREMLNKALSGNRNPALLLTEFGADSVPGLRSEHRSLWSEEYHADLLREVFLLAEDYPSIQGFFPFCFSDYRDPSKELNGFWNELNLKGVVTYDRKQKLAFKALADIYNEKPKMERENRGLHGLRGLGKEAR